MVQAVSGDTAISYSGTDLRNVVAALAPLSGVLRAGDLLVSQRAAGANMSVDVAAGGAIIAGTSLSGQGSYVVRSSAVVNVPLAAADPTNGRFDLIVARVHDKQADGGTTYAWSPEVVTGTPSGSPAYPTQPPNSLFLSQVYVGPRVTSVSNGSNIVDQRVLSGTGDIPKWDMSGTTATPQSIAAGATVNYTPQTIFQHIGALTNVEAPGLSTGEVQLLTPGRYAVHFCFRMPNISASYPRTAIVQLTDKDGTTLRRRVSQDLTATASSAVCASGTIYVQAYQRIQARIYNGAGSAVSLDDTGFETNFTGVWVGP
jgi:hypothetical protein